MNLLVLAVKDHMLKVEQMVTRRRVLRQNGGQGGADGPECSEFTSCSMCLLYDCAWCAVKPASEQYCTEDFPDTCPSKRFHIGNNGAFQQCPSSTRPAQHSRSSGKGHETYEL